MASSIAVTRASSDIQQNAHKQARQGLFAHVPKWVVVSFPEQPKQSNGVKIRAYWTMFSILLHFMSYATHVGFYTLDLGGVWSMILKCIFQASTLQS